MWDIERKQRYCRYSDIKGSCILIGLEDQKSRATFFQDMWFLQKVRKPTILSYSSKKVRMNGLGFSVLKSCSANGETDEWREEKNQIHWALPLAQVSNKYSQHYWKGRRC